MGGKYSVSVGRTCQNEDVYWCVVKTNIAVRRQKKKTTLKKKMYIHSPGGGSTVTEEMKVSI